jgi:hypothetical protein
MSLGISLVPYKSTAQQKFFHSSGAKKAGISKDTVEEFDKETSGEFKSLPEKASKPKKVIRKR